MITFAIDLEASEEKYREGDLINPMLSKLFRKYTPRNYTWAEYPNAMLRGWGGFTWMNWVTGILYIKGDYWDCHINYNAYLDVGFAFKSRLDGTTVEAVMCDGIIYNTFSSFGNIFIVVNEQRVGIPVMYIGLSKLLMKYRIRRALKKKL